jgi:G3E family GTPase
LLSLTRSGKAKAFARQIAANLLLFVLVCSAHIRQIALADLVILNKTDLAADQEQLHSHKMRIRSENTWKKG